MKPSPQGANVEVKELSVWDETLLSVWDETLAESVWCPCDIAAWVYMMHVSMQLSMPHTLCHVMQACTCIRVRNIMHSLRLIYYNYHGEVGLRPPTRDKWREGMSQPQLTPTYLAQVHARYLSKTARMSSASGGRAATVG